MSGTGWVAQRATPQHPLVCARCARALVSMWTHEQTGLVLCGRCRWADR